MSVALELKRMEQHRKWLRWLDEKGAKDEERERPEPGYRDCRNCPHSRSEEEARRALCNPCVYDGNDPLPLSPSVHFIRCDLLSQLPGGAVLDMARDGKVSFATARDVEAIRASRSAF